MIFRKNFNSEYPVRDGMSWDSLNAQKSKAWDDVLNQINYWKKSYPLVTILGIQYDSFTSSNSDLSPFWVRAYVTYEEYEDENKAIVSE